MLVLGEAELFFLGGCAFDLDAVDVFRLHRVDGVVQAGQQIDQLLGGALGNELGKEDEAKYAEE